MLKTFVRRTLDRFGYMVVRKQAALPGFPDMEEKFTPLLARCRPYSMTSVERMYALHKAVEYVAKKNIPGDLVECGVWKGGSSMMTAHTLSHLGERNRTLYLYDTFEGMSAPTDKDKNINDKPAAVEWQQHQAAQAGWFAASLPEVRENLLSTGYPAEKLTFVKGKVEETIPGVIPAQVALLRLDTDWYESTYHELQYLYPRLSPGGVLIIDDYGYWKGSREAVDQYFREHHIHMLLTRVDTDCRIGIKMEP